MSVRRELVLRICPDEHSIRVEDINNGVTSFKKIALETFYDCVRHSIRHEGVRSGFLPQNCFHVGVSENGERDFCLWHPYLRADISYFGTEYPDFPLPRLVLAALSESVRASLENESILSPEAYLKRRREEIRDLEQNVIYLSGQRDLLNTQRVNGTENLRALQERRDALVRERDALEEKRFAGLDLAGMREQLVDLSARYDDMAKDSARGMDTTEIDRRLQELHHKLGRRGVEQYAPKYTQHIAEASAKVKELGVKYSRELALLKGFQPGVVCPTCRRAVSESDLGAVQAGIRKSLAAITEEGRAQKSQLDELQALEKQSEETFLQFQKDDVAQISREIEELNRRRQGIEAAQAANRDRRKDELESLHSQIQAVAADIEYGNLSQEDYDRLAECRELLRECQADLDAAKRRRWRNRRITTPRSPRWRASFWIRKSCWPTPSSMWANARS